MLERWTAPFLRSKKPPVIKKSQNSTFWLTGKIINCFKCMKSFHITGRKAFSLFFVLLETFFISCGLEEIITVNPPTLRLNDPIYSNADFLKDYVSFAVNESNQPDTFIGTEVYYKIYNNSKDLISQQNSILSVNSSSNSTVAAVKMIDTYKFQSLNIFPSVSQTLFIPKGSGYKIIFRIKTEKGNENYGSSESEDTESFESFRACVKFSGRLRAFVNGSPVFVDYSSTEGWMAYGTADSNSGTPVSYGDISFMVPYRNNGKSFDFFDDLDTKLDEHTEPSESDDDYFHNSTASEANTYYVQFFAVAVAFDTSSLGYTYSTVLDLGSVSIRKNK